MTIVNTTTLTFVGMLILGVCLVTSEYPGKAWDLALHKHEKYDKRARVTANTDSDCSRFLHKSDALTIRSKVVRKIGNGATPEICKRACLEARDFTCAAAQIQLPATCYITGYQLRHDFFSTHYRRICEHGPDCFVEERGMSGGFTEREPIPAYFQLSEHIKTLYCMARCEQITACVGFDMRRESKAAHCMFLDMGIYTDYTFDLYMRRC